MNNKSNFIDLNERFELVSKRFYAKLVWTYQHFVENSRDKEYAKAYFSDLSPLIWGMPTDKFSLQLNELFNHEYKVGTDINKIIEQALVLRRNYKKKLKDKEINDSSISNLEIEPSAKNNGPKFIPITSSIFKKDDANPNAYFKFFVAYKAKTNFLYFILREQNDIVSKEKLQELLPLVVDKIFTNNPNELTSVEQSNDNEIERNVENKINWLGTQKELGELFVELLQKGWINELNAKKIQALFSKSNTISQVIKPSQQLIPDEQGNKKIENQYEQIYTAKYQPKFDTIRKNPKKKS
jgi:hypothetical protein